MHEGNNSGDNPLYSAWLAKDDTLFVQPFLLFPKNFENPAFFHLSISRRQIYSISYSSFVFLLSAPKTIDAHQMRRTGASCFSAPKQKSPLCRARMGNHRLNRGKR